MVVICSIIVWVLTCVSPVSGARFQSAELEASPSSAEYFYRFTSPVFEIAQAELRFDEKGRGEFTFQRKTDEGPIRLDLQLLPGTLERINELFREADFLDGKVNYQGERNLSHLSTTTVRFRRGTRERQVSFNYTRHPAMRQLSRLLRNIVTQESRMFAIKLARQYEPLGLTRQLIGLKREVKNGWVAEPGKLTPLLEDLQSDDGLLLIARRRAGEILRLIKKQ